MREIDVSCPDCKAPRGVPCRIVIDGVPESGNHDGRIMRAMFAARPDPYPDAAVPPG